MPQRSRKHLRGDLGHLEVAKALLETGSSINSLTFSDYGVDIHLLLPLDLTLPGASAAMWGMSNWAVHVQVKTLSNEHAWPALNIDHLTVWNKGRVPVYLFLKKSGKIFMSDPWSLSQVLERSREGAKSVNTREGDYVDYSAKDFLAEMALWLNIPLQGAAGLKDLALDRDTVCDFVAARLMADGRTLGSVPYLSTDFAAEYCHALDIDAMDDHYEGARRAAAEYTESNPQGQTLNWARPAVYMRAGVLGTLKEALGTTHSDALHWLLTWMRARDVSHEWHYGYPAQD